MKIVKILVLLVCIFSFEVNAQLESEWDMKYGDDGFYYSPINFDFSTANKFFVLIKKRLVKFKNSQVDYEVWVLDKKGNVVKTLSLTKIVLEAKKNTVWSIYDIAFFEGKIYFLLELDGKVKILALDENLTKETFYDPGTQFEHKLHLRKFIKTKGRFFAAGNLNNQAALIDLNVKQKKNLVFSYDLDTEHKNCYQNVIDAKIISDGKLNILAECVLYERTVSDFYPADSKFYLIEQQENTLPKEISRYAGRSASLVKMSNKWHVLHDTKIDQSQHIVISSTTDKREISVFESATGGLNQFDAVYGDDFLNIAINTGREILLKAYLKDSAVPKIASGRGNNNSRRVVAIKNSGDGIYLLTKVPHETKEHEPNFKFGIIKLAKL